jgi:hypothetical protein
MKRAIYYGFHYYDRYFNSRQNTLFFKSPFLNAEIEGKYKLTTIADAITNSFSTYYNPYSFQLPPQSSSCDSKAISDSPILVKFIPELKSLEPISFSGHYDTVNDSIVLNAAIPKLVAALLLQTQCLK